MNWLQMRRALFVCSLCALLISVAVLIGSYVRTVHSTDYFKQFEEAEPWLRWGFNSAFVGLLFSFFGKGFARIAASTAGGLLTVFWLLLAGSSL